MTDIDLLRIWDLSKIEPKIIKQVVGEFVRSDHTNVKTLF